MRYMEIDFHPMDITIWVKDDQLKKCWVRSYYSYKDGRFKTPQMVLDHAFNVANLYGVSYIRVLERIDSYAYDYMESHPARQASGGRYIPIEKYLYYDL